jgi:hypothetical protein
MATTRVRTRPRDEVDRAVEGMGRATYKLIALLDSEDEEVVRKALNVPLRRVNPQAAVAYPGRGPDATREGTRLIRRVANDLATIGGRIREPATAMLIACLLPEGDQSFAGTS